MMKNNLYQAFATYAAHAMNYDVLGEIIKHCDFPTTVAWSKINRRIQQTTETDFRYKFNRWHNEQSYRQLGIDNAQDVHVSTVGLTVERNRCSLPLLVVRKIIVDTKSDCTIDLLVNGQPLITAQFAQQFNDWVFPVAQCYYISVILQCNFATDSTATVKTFYSCMFAKLGSRVTIIVPKTNLEILFINGCCTKSPNNTFEWYSIF